MSKKVIYIGVDVDDNAFNATALLIRISCRHGLDLISENIPLVESIIGLASQSMAIDTSEQPLLKPIRSYQELSEYTTS